MPQTGGVNVDFTLLPGRGLKCDDWKLRINAEGTQAPHETKNLAEVEKATANRLKNAALH